jgi:ubiquitin carboxyl-terminal hydrolase 8
MQSLFSEYANRGLSGLTNVGNSCYLNSCMQILSHTYELNDFLKKGEYKKKLNRLPDSVILLEWDKLRDLMWSANCTIAPHGFVKTIRKIAAIKNRDIFTGHDQNDVQEFLLFLIDAFHTALAREVEMQINGQMQTETDKLAIVCYTMMKNMYKKEYSEMLNIFYGIHVSEIVSNKTGESVSAMPEPFSVLSLSLPTAEKEKTPTLYDCFDLYCEPEQLSAANGNAWFNDKTQQKEDAQRRISFWSLPNILIIDLKRWNSHTRKNHNRVDIPLQDADFSKYVKGYNAASYKYDLFGVCNHGGGAQGGHYTAYIKNANGKWYEFNDTFVKEINETDVISPQSYCLFYRKKI